MKRGDIYFVDLEPTVGHEQQGKRPVLVISPDRFNAATNAPVVLPITNGGGFAVRLGLAVSVPLSMQTTGVVRCDQPRAIDLQGREARFLETSPPFFLREVLDRFLAILDPEPEQQ